MPFNDSPCEPWPVDFTCEQIPDGTPQSTIDKWTLYATQYLWMMTGRRFGPSCPFTVRPCRKTCFDGFADRFLNQGQYQNSGGWIPYLGADGQWRNASLCGCATACNCGPELCEVDLRGPVYDITEVKIDGVAVPGATYVLDDGRLLVRTRLNPEDDANCWPSCQDLTLPDTETGTFSITYRAGLALPQMLLMAAGSLAAHFIRGCGGGCGCGTSTRQNLSRIQRQGVELEFADPTELFTDGRTGIESVDFAIRALNPAGLAGPGRVLSPDAPRYGRSRVGGF